MSVLIHQGTHITTLDAEHAEECHCKNCGTVFRGNYCPGCGQSAKTKRLTIFDGFQNILGIFTNAEQGVVHTCIDLVYRPGYMIHDYVHGHRVEYTRPIQLLFLLSTIYYFVHYAVYLGPVDSGVSAEYPSEMASFMVPILKVLRSIFSNQANLSLFSVALLIIPYWIVFRRTDEGKRINLSEFFFVMTYIACQQMIFSILQLPFNALNGNDSSTSIGISFFFTIWSFRQFFRLTWRQTITKCLQSYVLMGIPVLIVLGIINIANRYM